MSDEPKERPPKLVCCVCGKPANFHVTTIEVGSKKIVVHYCEEHGRAAAKELK